MVNEYSDIPVYEMDTGRKTKTKIPANFVKMPQAWIKRLEEVTGASVYRLALYLQYRNWKYPGTDIVLSNVALGAWGISRSQKSAALGKLKSLGLVKVTQEGQQAPVVRLA
jgi:hypothetical protein